MKSLGAIIPLFIAWCFSTLPGEPGRQSDERIIASVDTALQKLVIVHQTIKEIHPFLASLHPIAVVEDSSLFIFDADSVTGTYRFQKKVPVPFPMQKGIRASFPLTSYEGRPTCVVSREIFESLDGYATLFHEFVHCAQFLTCENKLKQRLHITQTATRTKNYSWEITHAFPYDDSVFVKSYGAFLKALTSHNIEAAREGARFFKHQLSRDDYEYLVWVEWKEGMARFIENNIRTALGLKENQGGNAEPFNRVTFYFGGEQLIRTLSAGKPDQAFDAERLFVRMYTFADSR